MPNLIPYATRAVSGEMVQTVDARDLHTFLGISKDYHAWMRQQIKRARLLEGRDFTTYQEVGSSRGGRAQQDYYVTFDAAKHIGMLSNTDKGVEVREYFLSCERQAQGTPGIASPWDIMAQLVETGRQQEQQLKVLEAAERRHDQALIAQQQQLLEALKQSQQADHKADTALEGQQFQTIAEYVFLNDLQRQVPESLYHEFGLHLSDYCQKRAIPVRKIPVANKRWDAELGYHAGTIAQVLPGWLRRRYAQTELRILDGGAA